MELVDFLNFMIMIKNLTNSNTKWFLSAWNTFSKMIQQLIKKNDNDTVSVFQFYMIIVRDFQVVFYSIDSWLQPLMVDNQLVHAIEWRSNFTNNGNILRFLQTQKILDTRKNDLPSYLCVKSKICWIIIFIMWVWNWFIQSMNDVC